MRRQLTGGRAGVCRLGAAAFPPLGGSFTHLQRQTLASWTCWASRRGLSSGPPPPAPSARGMAADTTRPAASARGVAHLLSATPFTVQEVRLLTLPLIPCVSAFPDPTAETGVDASVPPGIRSSQLLQKLPAALRVYLESYQRSPASAAAASAPAPGDTPAPCAVLLFASVLAREKLREEVAKLFEGGILAYLADHFPDEVAVVMPGRRLLRREPPKAAAAAAVDAGAPPSASSALPSASAPSPDGGATHPSPAEVDGSTNPPPSTPSPTAPFSDATAPPPPPQPRGRPQRYGGISGGGGVNPSFFGSAAVPAGGAGNDNNNGGGGGGFGGEAADTNAPDLHSLLGIMEALVEYIPTFYINVDIIEPTLPSTIQALYADTSLRFFLKRFRSYVESRASHGSAEVRLRPTFDHPKRGMADARYQTAAAGDMGAIQGFRRPPRNSEANLISVIAPQVPKEFTPLADVLQEVAPIVSRHPAFDARLGVTGLLAKYPEYFQVVDGKLRARPYREAPNSLRNLDTSTSPLPDVYAKVLACVEQAAEGKNFAEAAEKTAAMVSTGRLYSLLTAAEKTEVKTKCRSFPTFLRLHGKDIVVSVDKMRVYKFVPEHEACVDTLMSERLRMNSLDPNDPVLKIPAEMAAETNAEWAVRELYDALPLMQCAELDELLSLVPPAVRDALPKEVAGVKALLEQYEDYFALWPYPDDEQVIVVQRAKVEQPELCKADIVRMVVPLIPQGGTTLTSLRTRAPLQLQRYFSRHGTVATLGAMKDIFAIAGDRIVRLA